MNEKLVFNEIISDKTHYGIIWNGRYKGTECVIKVVILDSGIHYDNRKNEYNVGNKKITKGEALNNFKENNIKPYIHEKYKDRKAMSVEKFTYEVNMLYNMGKSGIAPKLYKYFIDNNSYEIHYGFIVMEKMHMSIKDILLKRDLNNDEMDEILRKIEKLHKIGIKHGDLKASNICVDIDNKGKIKKIKIIDWAKAKYTKDEKDFEKDRKTLIKHINKNMLER